MAIYHLGLPRDDSRPRLPRFVLADVCVLCGKPIPAVPVTVEYSDLFSSSIEVIQLALDRMPWTSFFSPASDRTRCVTLSKKSRWRNAHLAIRRTSALPLTTRTPRRAGSFTLDFRRHEANIVPAQSGDEAPIRRSASTNSDAFG